MVCKHKYPKGKGMVICTECGSKLDVEKLAGLNG
jgi:hypothetical protein